jgi:hypothetical protein
MSFDLMKLRQGMVSTGPILFPAEKKFLLPERLPVPYHFSNHSLQIPPGGIP